MSDPELRLDPAIRLWVFLPIVAITFLIGIIRHYVSVLLTSDKKVDLGKVRDSQVLLRSRALRENAKYLPKSSFLMRRHYMNNEETGLLKVNQAKPTQAPNPMTDPSMMTDMLKGDLKRNDIYSWTPERIFARKTSYWVDLYRPNLYSEVIFKLLNLRILPFYWMQIAFFDM